MSTLSIRRISYADILEDPSASRLIAAYAAERIDPSVGPINLGIDTYAAMEHSGSSRYFSVCEGKVLFGFANILQVVLPHYGRKFATVETIIVDLGHCRNLRCAFRNLQTVQRGIQELLRGRLKGTDARSIHGNALQGIDSNGGGGVRVRRPPLRSV